MAILYSGKLSREKFFFEFCSFVAICVSFLCEIWRRGVLWHGKSEQSAKVSIHENGIFHQFVKFSLLKVSRYTVSITSTVCI